MVEGHSTILHTRDTQFEDEDRCSGHRLTLVFVYHIIISEEESAAQWFSRY